MNKGYMKFLAALSALALGLPAIAGAQDIDAVKADVQTVWSFGAFGSTDPNSTDPNDYIQPEGKLPGYCKANPSRDGCDPQLMLRSEWRRDSLIAKLDSAQKSLGGETKTLKNGKTIVTEPKLSTAVDYMNSFGSLAFGMYPGQIEADALCTLAIGSPYVRDATDYSTSTGGAQGVIDAICTDPSLDGYYGCDTNFADSLAQEGISCP